MVVVLHRHLGKLFDRCAIGLGMNHARLTKHGRGRARTEQTFRGRAGGSGTAQQTLGILLRTKRQRHIVFAALDGDVRLAECGSARSAGVGHVDAGNPGLANLLQHLLANHRRGVEAGRRVDHVKIVHRQPCIIERQERRLGAQLGRGAIRIAAEFDQISTNDIDIRHAASPARGTK